MAKLSPRQAQVAERTLEELVDEHMRELRDRIAALEEACANATSANGSRARVAPAKARPKGDPRWLDSARFASKCQANCGQPVRQGERVYYVPGLGVYHEACAPADTKAAA